MRLSRVLCASFCALGLGVTACDSGIVFPGFSDPGEEETTLPPPPNVPVADDLPPPPRVPALPDDPKPPAPPPQIPEDADPPEISEPLDTATGIPQSPADTAPTETATTPDPIAPALPDLPDDTSVPNIPTTQIPPPPEIESEPEPKQPPAAPIAPAFSYHAPGSLTPGSGKGSPDQTVYAPDMVFPIKDARAFPQSMVFQPGGFRYAGDLPGDECIPENYEYPWRDNFCERGRPSSFKSASCPAGSGVHLGQDIRVGDGPTCESMRRRYRTNTQSITDYKVVAAETGLITNISSYTVTLRAGPRTYRYLHMNMRALQVSVGDSVEAGDLLGYVSKDFGFRNGRRRPTTFHLHFVLKINTDEGSVFVPPYTSLVESYARREGAPGQQLERNIAVASSVLDYDPNEVFEEIE